MVNSNNGFEIAEADLHLRGHGDLEGTQQSGEGLDLKITGLAADGRMLQYARDIAQEVLNQRPRDYCPNPTGFERKVKNTLYPEDKLEYD